MTRAENIRQIPYYQELRANGRGAADALASLRRHWAFMAQLSADVKQHKKRSAAAKKAWRKRKQNRES